MLLNQCLLSSICIRVSHIRNWRECARPWEDGCLLLPRYPYIVLRQSFILYPSVLVLIDFTNFGVICCTSATSQTSTKVNFVFSLQWWCLCYTLRPRFLDCETFLKVLEDTIRLNQSLWPLHWGHLVMTYVHTYVIQ